MIGLGLAITVVTRGGRLAAPTPPAWTPAALGPRLVAWWDPSEPSAVVAAGEAIAQLTDRSGRGRHLVQPTAALQPTLAPGGAGFAGRAVAAFTADRLQAQSGWWDTGNYAVALVGATSGDGDLVGSGAVVSAGDVLLMRYGGKLRSHHWTAPGALDGTTALGASAHVVVQHRAGASLGLYLDGREEAASTGAVGSSAGRTFILGGRSTATTSTWTCGEVVLADAIEAADRQRLEGYLAWRWGLQGGLPTTHPYRDAPP